MTWTEVQERIATAIAAVHAGESPVDVFKCSSINPKVGKGNDFVVLIVDAKQPTDLLQGDVFDPLDGTFLSLQRGVFDPVHGTFLSQQEGRFRPIAFPLPLIGSVIFQPPFNCGFHGYIESSFLPLPSKPLRRPASTVFRCRPNGRGSSKGK